MFSTFYMHVYPTVTRVAKLIQQQMHFFHQSFTKVIYIEEDDAAELKLDHQMQYFNDLAQNEVEMMRKNKKCEM